MATFHFDLVSPEKMVFSGEVTQVDVPGTEGDFGVLAGHAPFVSTLRPGILTIHADSHKKRIVVLGGFAEVGPSGLSVLADLADDVKDFDKAVLDTYIESAEAEAKEAEGSAFDRIIERIDHYKTVEDHINGTAMH